MEDCNEGKEILSFQDGNLLIIFFYKKKTHIEDGKSFLNAIFSFATHKPPRLELI